MNTKNDMVNNWAMELQQFPIQFEYIEGIKNTLADTMSRLVKIDPDIEKDPEKPDQEFGKYVFDKLDPVLVEVVFEIDQKLKQKNDIQIEKLKKKEGPIPSDIKVDWTVSVDQLRLLQVKDEFCKRIIKRTMKDSTENKTSAYPYYINEGILCRYVTDNKQRFETRVVPQGCAQRLLKLAHDDLGHNGSACTYMLLRQNYFWKGMKPQVYKYVKQCSKCQACNAQVVKYYKGHFNVPKAPMDFISMDLIGEFRPPTSQGYKYALTVICMLAGFTWCIPIKSKNAEEIVKAYMREIYYKYGGSRKILSDNGTEFKNDLFTLVAEKLGVEHKIFTPQFGPQSNRRIEGFHQFLKACLAKHI